jgi:hypothetical protein
LPAHQIRPLTKTLIADFSKLHALPGKLEGLAIVDRQTIAVVNDNDFGFEGFNSDKLNAKPFYFGAAAVPDKLPVKTNNYGATVGGPIKHDKLFFFGSFEGYKRSQSLFTFFSVPDAALRAGDFSKALNTNGSVQQIYNPFTGNADGTGRAQFANNQIPQSMINPISLQIMKLAPMPNTAGIGAGGLTNNYQRQEDRQVDRQNYDVKMNWNRTATHQLWVKFSHMHAIVDDLTIVRLQPVAGEGARFVMWNGDPASNLACPVTTPPNATGTIIATVSSDAACIAIFEAATTIPPPTTPGVSPAAGGK